MLPDLLHQYIHEDNHAKILDWLTVSRITVYNRFTRETNGLNRAILIRHIKQELQNLQKFEDESLGFYDRLYKSPSALGSYKLFEYEYVMGVSIEHIVHFDYIRLVYGYYRNSDNLPTERAIRQVANKLEYKEFLLCELEKLEPKPKQLTNGFYWIGTDAQLVLLHEVLIVNRLINSIDYQEFENIFNSNDFEQSIVWLGSKRQLVYFFEALITSDFLRKDTSYDSIISKLYCFAVLDKNINKAERIKPNELNVAKSQMKQKTVSYPEIEAIITSIKQA